MGWVPLENRRGAKNAEKTRKENNFIRIRCLEIADGEENNHSQIKFFSASFAPLRFILSSIAGVLRAGDPTPMISDLARHCFLKPQGQKLETKDKDFTAEARRTQRR